MSTPAASAAADSRRLRYRAASVGADPVLVVAGAVSALLVAIAVVGPFLAPYSPSSTDILNANAGWSSEHWLGTDELGRDVLSRVLYGARISLLGAGLIVALATALGTAIAIATVWLRGRFDRGVMRVVDVLFAFPAVLFAILAVAIFDPGLIPPVIALSIAYTPYFARVGRGAALHERYQPYVEACQLAGLSGWRICFRHILPNIRALVQAQATIAFGFALIDIAAISFLGLGVQPPTAEWGLMVADGRTSLLNGHAAAALAPGVMIIISVVAFNVLGERLAARARAGG